MFLTFTPILIIRGRILSMDKIDQKILAIIQHDGRISITDLAKAVGLSISPCHRRLAELEKSGVIRGYQAVIDAEKVGLRFEALVFVTMKQEDRETLLSFEAGLVDIPNVLQAERLFGDPDYLLRIATADLQAFQNLQDEKLTVLPGVQRFTSTLVMKRIVVNRPLPIQSNMSLNTISNVSGTRF